jgi:L-amino acid N-acyltransferase YncA
MADLTIRPAVPADAGAISAIYNHYVRTSTCTFQEEPDTLAERLAWLERHRGAHVALVAEEPGGGLAGWASLSPFHARSAYRFTVEDSVYLRDDCRGRGLGKLLLGRLMDDARAGGFRNVMACICAEQEASIALHKRAGFREVGRMTQVGMKFGRWLDVVYLQHGPGA